MGFIKTVKREVHFFKALKRTLNHATAVENDYENLLTDDFEASVDKFPDNVVFYFEGTSLTYAEFDRRANRVAHWALDQGFKPGDVVAVFMENSPDYVATWFGLSKAGVVAALINNNLDGAGLAHCMNIVGVKAVIADDGLAGRVKDIEATLDGTPTLWDWGGTVGQGFNEALAKMSDERPSREIRAGVTARDLILYVYTSGTTGLPKAAKITHMRTRRALRLPLGACEMTPEDRVYITLPLYHVTGGFLGLGAVLLSGASGIIRRKFSASAFWDDVSDNGATMIIYIGELCRYLVNQPPHPKERAHNLRVGLGNGLRGDIWQKFVDRFNVPKMLELYGSTEGNVFLLNFEGKVGAVGRIPNWLRKQFGHVQFVKFDVVEEEPIRNADGFCITADVDEPGEVLGRITEDEQSKFEGYHDKGATDKKILRDVFEKGDSWFRTGDLMSKDKDGYIYFHDRIGDTFRWKGENVATNEVSEVFSQCNGVTTANVYGVEIAGTDGRAGMASITMEEGSDVASLYQQLSQELPPYAVPVFIRVQQEAETTGTFKYRKVELVKEGFDLNKVTDPIWFAPAGAKVYQPLAVDDHEKILAGGVKF